MTPDLVVVGAGSAGAVIAARVSERPDRSVLLLEAGPDYGAAPLPSDLVDGTRNSFRAHDWGYVHRPAAGQFLFPFPRGRVVGGSSAVNTCVALRGQPYDYDEWGLDDWTWEKCLPAFKRLETDLDFRDSPWHGDRGPIPIRRHPRHELARWQAAFLDACAHTGHPSCPDSNDPTTTGAGPHAMNKVNERRMSAARYLDATVRARPNFALSADTLVHRVVIRAGRVEGLEIERRGRRETIATRHVVLSAGAIATPGILLRSGIGPRRAVLRVGGTPLIELPAVGARLLDHAGAAFFVLPRRGVCDTRAGIIQTCLRLSLERPNDIILQPGSHVALPMGRSIPGVSMMVAVGKPRGHGWIEYTSADPRAKPLIHSAILHHAADRDQAVTALQVGYDIVKRSEMGKLGTFVWPPEPILSRRSRLEKFVRIICDSGYHPSGTVPMGAAVDSRGRIAGLEGLTVADASIMPTIPTANINLTTLMIGERFGEWLRE